MKTIAVFIALLYYFLTSAQDQKIDSSEISLPVRKATISATIYTPVNAQKPPVGAD